MSEAVFAAEEATAVVRVGAQNPGHPWWAVAEIVLEELVGFTAPLLPSVRAGLFTPSALQGARNNPIEVSEGELDLGITTPAVSARMAVEGTGIYDRPYPGLRAICSYPHIDFVVFAVDAATGIASFEELIERRHPLRLVTGRKAGDSADVLTFTVEQVLRGYGIGYETIEEWGGEVIYGGPTHVGGLLVLEGRANALFQESQTAYVWRKIAESRPINLLPVREDVRASLEERFGLAQAVVPAGHYPGVDVETPTVDFSGWLLFCREDIPDEWAYAFAQACDVTRGKVEEVVEVRRSLQVPIDPRYLFRETAIPLHPGAERYAREQGYL